MPILRVLGAIRDYAILAFGITLLALMCAAWGVVSAVFLLVLPARTGRRVGRVVAMFGFRSYLAIMQALGALRLDLAELDNLREEPPLIVAPNHPSLIDAVLVVSRLPDAMCVMKASLLGNFLLGPAARLARYIRNDTLLGLAARAGEELRHGGHLVLFPEGTRTAREPVGPFTGAAAVIARRTGVPVQAVFIEADSRFLGKGWPVHARPAFPLRYRARLGRRFDPPKDVRAFTAELESYFAQELGGRPAQAGFGAPTRSFAGVPPDVRDLHD
ncbi:MAG TPA: lysophospholipid acyltransferase family protein [Usitatibacteraceae bacterium]|nr:lysophospholipid acyltransferase family protein [Usitatibacteraceae bacterium]